MYGLISHSVFKPNKTMKRETRILNQMFDRMFATNGKKSEITTVLPLEKMRNIGISAHIDSGKTTLTERILFYTGRIKSIHEVRGKDGVGATMDSMELERMRGITIQSAATYTVWRGVNINIIDTPGHVDFTIEVERALRVLDGAVLVLCGVSGVQSQSLTVNRQIQRYDIPRLAFINKLDRMGADPYKVLQQIKSKLKHNAAFIQLPIGLERGMKGVIDIVESKCFFFNGDFGQEVTVDENLPTEYRTEVDERRHELIEHLANSDEHMADIFLEERQPTVEEIHQSINRSVVARTFTPVLVGTALKNKGVQPLLDAIVRYLPNPSQVQNFAISNEVKKSANRERGEDTSDQDSTSSIEEKVQKVILDPQRNSSKPFVGLAFKLERGKYGQLTYVRAYQGCVNKGDTLINTRTGRKVRVPRLVQMHAESMEEISVAYAGDICAIFGVDCATGDTFVASDETTQNEMNVANLSMESMHVPQPVISMSMIVKDKKGNDNFSKAIQRFTKEDPTFRVEYDVELKETVAHGMGELHLEIYAQRMEREYGCAVELGKPKVAFREALINKVEFDYWHRKQTGGRGEYARVKGFVEPMPRNDNMRNAFKDSTVGNNIPRNFIPPCRKAFHACCEKGHLSGFPVVGVRMILLDGATHEVDSSDQAFDTAIKLAFEQCIEHGKWCVLEPIMSVEVNVPSEFQGVVMSMLTKRNSVIISSEGNEESVCIQVETPLNNMFGFSYELRSGTQGKGEYTMEYCRYSPAESDLQSELIEKYTESQNPSSSSNSQQQRKKQQGGKRK